jgi:Mor family transcriptional regulator
VVDLQPAGEPAAFDENDLVHDILHRVQAMFDLPTERLVELEQRVRHDWGGERPYIPRLGESARLIRSKRDERIRAEHRRGERVELLARRWGMTERRVRQILAEDAPPA